MKKSLIALAALAAIGLPGCASLDNAGHAAYSTTAVKDPSGKVTGYEFSVKDGKEFEARAISFQTDGAGYAVTIQEGQSKAFKGQGIAAKAATILPVNGLPDILK